MTLALQLSLVSLIDSVFLLCHSASDVTLLPRIPAPNELSVGVTLFLVTFCRIGYQCF